jgi:hypothetical protein
VGEKTFASPADFSTLFLENGWAVGNGQEKSETKTTTCAGCNGLLLLHPRFLSSLCFLASMSLKPSAQDKKNQESQL